MADIIQQRRDTAARWKQYNPILLEGEVGYVTDNPNQYKIGDGKTPWNSLPLRGYTGTITQETGSDENAVMSQKAVTEKLSELASEVDDFKEAVTDQVNNYKPIEINGNVTNAADEEDITSDENSLLKLKDRSALNSMGYVILRKSKSFAEQVTLQNTIYEIRYNFDLNGGEITIPEGCVLNFQGGSLSNGRLVGEETSISADDSCIFKNITFEGSFNGSLNAMWVGAKAYDSNCDNSFVLQNWLNSYCGVFSEIQFPCQIYYFKTPIQINEDKRRLRIVGNNSTFRVGLSHEGEIFLNVYQCENFIISGLSISNINEIDGYKLSKNTAIRFNRTQNFNIEDIYVERFDKAIWLTDVWYGNFTGRITLQNNRIGIYADAEVSTEVNTVNFNNIRYLGCSFEAVQALYPKLEGETDKEYTLRAGRCGVDFHCNTNGCKFYGMVIENADYGIRFNWRKRNPTGYEVGLLNINSCYFENNTTYDIYVGKGYVEGDSGNYLFFMYNMSILNCRFYVLKKMYLDGISSCRISNCHESANIVVQKTQSLMRSGYLRYDDSVVIDSYPDGIYLIKESCKPTSMRFDGSAENVPIDMNQHLSNIEYGNNIGALMRSDLDPNTSAYSSTGTGVYRYLPNKVSVTNSSELKMQSILKPYDFEYKKETGGLKQKTSSGYKATYASATIIGSTICTMTKGEGITLVDFMRRWKNGQDYNGYVKEVFPYKVRISSEEGLLYMENYQGVESVYGFGAKAIQLGTMTFENAKTYLDLDSFIYVRYTYNIVKFYADLIQGNRNYSEILSTGNSASINKTARYLCNEEQKDNLVKRVNCIIYNTDTNQHEIYNGFEWLPLEDYRNRYDYSEFGVSIKERASVPDYPSQTFYNAATGILYTYYVKYDKLSGKWMSSIGNVESLTNPNGYHSSSNPVTYSEELAQGEKVVYNGSIYTWDGEGFVKDVDGYSASGTFKSKPSSNIGVGFAYFCTDKKSSESSDNGMMIYHKGEGVWVDALGRIVE